MCIRDSYYTLRLNCCREHKIPQVEVFNRFNKYYSLFCYEVDAAAATGVMGTDTKCEDKNHMMNGWIPATNNRKYSLRLFPAVVDVTDGLYVSGPTDVTSANTCHFKVRTCFRCIKDFYEIH